MRVLTTDLPCGIEVDAHTDHSDAVIDDAAATVYRARRIITIDPVRPYATHVAVADGRIVAVGAELDMPSGSRADDRFADAVLLPGLIEGHSHADAGGRWDICFLGYFDRTGPNGERRTGARSIDEAVALLAKHAATDATNDEVVVGWGFDPIYFDRRIDRHDLDAVSSERPVAVLHASGHILSVNTRALERLRLFSSDVTTPASPRGPDGMPTGELKGMEMAFPSMARLGISSRLNGVDDRALRNFAKSCTNAGVTTATDLATILAPATVDTMLTASAGSDWPIRLLPALVMNGGDVEELIARAVKVRAQSNDGLQFGMLKIVLDGSIQGFSARLRSGTYANGAPNGLWYVPPERVRSVLDAAFREDLQVHIHTNGDEASELALDVLADALAATPAPNHRTTLQHAQLVDDGLLRRAKALGVGVNLFVNHVYYWGEQHAAHTVGEARAATMNPVRSAIDLGVPVTIHSDEPVTPIGPLFGAWCAVNRLTAAGRVLGPDQRISVPEALYAITMGAAASLRLEHDVGSIAFGKRADFAVLADDPLGVDPLSLRDIGVLGTVSRGRWFAAAT